MLEKILAVSVLDLRVGEVQRDEKTDATGGMRERWLGGKMIGRGD
jgi:hypothetical protein